MIVDRLRERRAEFQRQRQTESSALLDAGERSSTADTAFSIDNSTVQ